MPTVTLSHAADFEGWRDAARSLAQAGAPPSAVVWQVGGETADLLADDMPPPAGAPMFAVPRGFIDLARACVCHSDPERFALLYALLCRIRENPKVIENRADPLVHRLSAMAKEVGRDVHKMRAFVRFRDAADTEGERFVAWFEPDHHILRYNASFFVKRFANMRWSILTPEISMHWDGQSLSFTPGVTRAEAPAEDAVEDKWKAYFASIFNPARLKVKAMTKEMPQKYWKNMPETALIPGLIAGAQARTAAMIERDMTRRQPVEIAEDDEDYGSLAETRSAAMACTRCHLYKDATQTVFGEGPEDAPLMFVGEQPGDQEDLAGHPFIGPAGQKFNQALDLAGIDRGETYVTNAVKHFKFELRGKRRIHKSPTQREIAACHHWLEDEIALVKPAALVALGASAARSLFGRAVPVLANRGQWLRADGLQVLVTLHPSALLRVDPEGREAAFEAFVGDLRQAQRLFRG